MALGSVCGGLGYSRQAYYKHLKTSAAQEVGQAVIIKMVEAIRRDMPRIGVKKLYFMLKEPLVEHGINIGRDSLFNLLSDYGLLVRRRKRRKPLTTDSNHPFLKYPNLIRGLQVSRANRLWVSDITYIRAAGGFCYLSLITDAYSRKIVGWCLWRNLKRDGTVQALKMALEGLAGQKANGLIHHSDRGLQYCSKEYTNILESKEFIISMTEKGDPYENAIAERVNGILKTEFGLGERFNSYEHAYEAVRAAIYTYNNNRPHASCNYLTPQRAHLVTGALKHKWKKRRTRQMVNG